MPAILKKKHEAICPQRPNSASFALNDSRSYSVNFATDGPVQLYARIYSAAFHSTLQMRTD